MANKRFIRVALLAASVASIVATGSALLRARAQIATIQPFVAIMVEEVTPRPDQPPTPMTRTQTIAVRSDGSISRVTQWEVRLPSKVLFTREVIDATTKTHAEVEDQTRTIVKNGYYDIQVLKPGGPCKGQPAGQKEGFDVVYSEQPMGTSANDVQMTHKSWNAPHLGCFPIVQEWVGNIHGVFTDTMQTLASIKLGEPNPWYFAVPANYTTRTGDELWELLKPILSNEF